MRAKRDAVFAGLAFGISWLVWAPLAAGAALPPWYYYLAAAGPAAGALVAVRSERGRAALGPWLRRGLLRPVPAGIAALVGGTTAAVFAAAALADRAITGGWEGLAGIGRTAELPLWPPAATGALLLVSYGFCEELGWRGWLYPRWRDRWGSRTAAAAVGAAWILWHLPAFFCNPTYSGMGWFAAGWALSLMAGSVLLSWIYERTGGSVAAVALWHGVFDFISVSDSAGAVIAPVMSAAVLAAAPFLWRSLGKRA